MKKQVFVWAWVSFVAALIFPLLVFTIDAATGFIWRYDLQILVILSFGLLKLSPVVLGVAVTLHTIHSGQYRRLAIGLGVFHAVFGVSPLLNTIISGGAMGSGTSMYGYDYASLNEWWWVAGLEVSLLLIMGLRTLTSWAPSIWSRGVRVIALAVLGVAFVLVCYSELYMLYMEKRYVDPSVDRGLPIIFAVLGTAISGISVLWSGTERAMGKRWSKEERTMIKRAPVSLHCPKCSVLIEQPAGKKTRCGSCGVGIQVIVEEPRCSCGYLLYDFEGEKCPECGLKIPDRWRWEAPAESLPNPPLSDGEPASGAERD